MIDSLSVTIQLKQQEEAKLLQVQPHGGLRTSQSKKELLISPGYGGRNQGVSASMSEKSGVLEDIPERGASRAGHKTAKVNTRNQSNYNSTAKPSTTQS